MAATTTKSLQSSEVSVLEKDKRISQTSSISDGIRIEDGILIVDWKENDPENARNWSNQRRWIITAVISSLTFAAPIPSSMIAPGVAQLSKEFGLSNSVVSAMVTSIFVLAFAVGPLLFGPLSEIYGRSVVVQAANLFFVLWNTISGVSRTTAQIIIFRFLAGVGASAPVTIGHSILGDMWPEEKRGRVVAIYSLMPSLSPVIGPLLGSWIAERTTWRWVFWSMSLFEIPVVACGYLILRETYAPVLLERRAKQVLRSLEKTDNMPHGVIGYYAGVPVMAVKTVFSSQTRNWKTIFGTALTRPFALFFREPIVQVLGIYLAFIYGMLYLFLTTIPSTFKQVYGQSLGISGLNYIPLGIGIVIGSQFNANIMNPMYAHLKKRYGGVGRPEFRLPTMVPASILLPLGMLLTGWAAEKKFFWLVPDIGLAIFGMGMIVGFQCVQVYVVDAFAVYSASAMAAVTCLRSLAGFGFPLFAPAMYRELGYGVGNTVLGCIAIAIGCPAPWLFWIYGERLRKASRYSRK